MPLSFLRPQELPLPDGFVVSGTVLQGHVLAAPLHATLASAAVSGLDSTHHSSKVCVAAVDGRFSSPRSGREKDWRRPTKEATCRCKDDSGGMRPRSPRDGEQREPRHTAAARDRLVPSAGESLLGSVRDALPPPQPRQSLLLGPDAQGRWSRVSVQSIKYNDLSVGRAEAGQTGSFWLQARPTCPLAPPPPPRAPYLLPAPNTGAQP